MKKKNVILIISAVLLLAIVGGGIFAGFKITNSPYNLPKVFVGEIDVSGMTDDETRAALLEKGWGKRATTGVSVTLLDEFGFLGIDPVKSGLTLSVEDAVAAAKAYGHDGNIVQNLITYVVNFFKPVDINAENTAADEAYIDSMVGLVNDMFEDHMGTEEYTVIPEEEVLVMRKGSGKTELDTAALKTALVETLTAGESELKFDTILAEPAAPDFAAIRKELEKEPVDASYTEDGKFDVIDEVVGCKMDVSEAESVWNAASVGKEMRIPLEITWPETTGEELRGRLYHDLLGAVTTKYPNSGEQRRSNIRLATSKLDGLILYPGDEFSFNGVIGERTEEAGFLPAPAYVDGDVKDELGGGVCQVSSTLYAATAFAFLETVERECHYFPVNYMQLGTDATVTIPSEGGRSIDFKFRNNKNYPIKIVGYCNNDESTITFEIWGTLEENDYMPVKFDNSYTWQFDYMREIEAAYPDRPGYTIKFTHETYSFTDETGGGYRTLTHRQVIDKDGNIVLDEIINSKLKNGNFAMDTYYHH